MALAEIDRQLLERCLAKEPTAWRDFIDRFLGLFVHVVNQTASARSLRLSASDQEDLIGEVLVTLIDNDYAVLRRFRGSSSLATYLAVIARRVVVRRVVGPAASPVAAEPVVTHTLESLPPGSSDPVGAPVSPEEQRIDDAEQVEQLLERLDGPEAQTVRLFHLEGKSYQEISSVTGIPENSIGPMLSRAREKMRLGIAPTTPAGGASAGADQPAG